MEKKLRIQLFDQEGRLVEDRMVSQDPEISAGPKFTHDGVVRIEFTLDSKGDIEKAKTYLDQLVGNLPIGSKQGRKKLLKPSEDDPDMRENLIKDALENASDQDEFINYLRSQGFNFVMFDFLQSFQFPGLIIKDRHQEKYQWMIRCIKRGKNPKTDRYDPMLIFGIQLIPEHNEKVVIYLNGEFHSTQKIPVPGKPKEVFKKTRMIKFPHYMVEEERDKFRFELRQYETNPDRKLSKFFKRWRPFVENISSLPQDKED